MQRRRTGLLVLLLIVALGAAGWWLWQLDAGTAPRVNSELADDQPRKLQLIVDQLPDAPKEPAKPATPDTPTKEDKPAAQPDIPPVPDEPAIAPVYNDLLKRGGAVITFDLRDAQGQWLVEDSVTAKLVRKLGRYATDEDCFWSFDDGAVVCDGESSAGLEPGSYEIEIGAGNYGWLRHAFTVQRGEQGRFELRLPYWRRIITCSFNDLNGNALPFLPAAPRVETTSPAAPKQLESKSPGRILREPPTPSEGGMGGGGGRGGRGGFVRRGSGNSVYVTDGGKWYLAVFAGLHNIINAEGPGGPWPGTNLVIAGTFDSAADAHMEFRLDAPADLDTRYAESRRIGADDPGQRSLLAWAARKGAHPPLGDAADVAPTSRRVLLNITGAQGLQPWYASVLSDEEGQLQPAPDWEIGKYRPPRRRDGQWFFDIPMDTRAWMRLWDGAAFVTEAELIETTQMVTTIDRAVIAKEVDVLPWLLPQTVDGWAVHRSFRISWSEYEGELGPPIKFSQATFNLGRKSVLVPPLSELAAQERGTVFHEWMLAGSATRIDLRAAMGVHGWNPIRERVCGSSSLRADATEAFSMLNSGAQGPALKSGLYFRAVDASGAGLPWVEATLHTLQDDQRAQRLRALERQGDKDGWRPYLNRTFANTRFRDPQGLTDADLQRERVREFVGQDFERECKDDADLKFYLRTGAWYDSFTRLTTGEYGYHIDLGRKLEPGKKYVLYLWSNSRDDLNPDARIVFQAAEVSDLGVITLPAYTE